MKIVDLFLSKSISKKKKSILVLKHQSITNSPAD